MKTLIIFTSVHHHNTEKIAKTIADALNADLYTLDKVNTTVLESYDVIGFGSGIYYGKFHKAMINFIKSIPAQQGKKSFVFSTSGQGKVTLNKHFEKLLEQKNFQMIGTFACKGFDTYGPFKLIGGLCKGRPNDQDMQNAKEFAGSLLKALN